MPPKPSIRDCGRFANAGKYPVPPMKKTVP
jgi:hypothetical protein